MASFGAPVTGQDRASRDIGRIAGIGCMGPHQLKTREEEEKEFDEKSTREKLSFLAEKNRELFQEVQYLKKQGNRRDCEINKLIDLMRSHTHNGDGKAVVPVSFVPLS